MYHMGASRESTALLIGIHMLRAASGLLAACCGGEETCGLQIFFF